MWELIKAGGPVMWPIIFCSVLAMAITFERLWALRRKRVVPEHLLAQIWQTYRKDGISASQIQAVREHSMLGRVLAAGLLNINHPRESMKEAIEDEGRQVVHELERHLNALGTVVMVSPLLGLLGTVFGMIEAFTAISKAGVGDPGIVASGIAQALITTAAGLTVAIPALVAHRFLNRRVDGLVVAMEEQAIKMVDVMHGEREKSA